MKISSDIKSIQYLRAIAAISVLCFHVSDAYGLEFRVGAAGVDIFFVISGFIMWVTTEGKPVGPQEFMVRRLFRIVPLYWIATVATFVMAVLKPQFFFNMDTTVGNLIGSLLFLPVMKGEAMHPIVEQGWTLSYEMFFYLIFSISLLLPEFRRPWFLMAALVTVVMAHYLLPLGYLSVFTEPVILEFAAGIVIGRLWKQGFRLSFHASIGLMVVGFVLLLASDLMPHVDRAVRWGIPAVLLLSGAVFAERERGVPKLSFLHFLGDASYSIYIWHVLTGVLVTALLLRIGVRHAAQPVFLALGSLAFAIVCYLFIERPILRKMRPSRPQPAYRG
ncbi:MULTISPECIES: acyltransferase family protein [Rhizobium]|uniref:Exopolysaccharide production protein ExoZ n=1 Tax=Rhizobium paranaense TaxID=1650438 RepID=A0A7W8XMV4_9HYPH|nr:MULTISPECIES: acyltransferase [Rhizobium]MBB5572324.1 exopolysaccharide production protein ExoZ [Rhizobium paranaense]